MQNITERDTRVVLVQDVPNFSTCDTRIMRVTLPRLPWEPKIKRVEEEVA